MTMKDASWQLHDTTSSYTDSSVSVTLVLYNSFATRTRTSTALMASLDQGTVTTVSETQPILHSIGNIQHSINGEG